MSFREWVLGSAGVQLSKVPLRERVPRRGFSRHNKANSLLSDMFVFSKIQYSRRRRSSTVELRREEVVWGDENFIQKFAPHLFCSANIHPTL